MKWNKQQGVVLEQVLSLCEERDESFASASETAELALSVQILSPRTIRTTSTKFVRHTPACHIFKVEWTGRIYTTSWRRAPAWHERASIPFIVNKCFSYMLRSFVNLNVLFACWTKYSQHIRSSSKHIRSMLEISAQHWGNMYPVPSSLWERHIKLI